MFGLSHGFHWVLIDLLLRTWTFYQTPVALDEGVVQQRIYRRLAWRKTLTTMWSRMLLGRVLGCVESNFFLVILLKFDACILWVFLSYALFVLTEITNLEKKNWHTLLNRILTNLNNFSPIEFLSSTVKLYATWDNTASFPPELVSRLFPGNCFLKEFRNLLYNFFPVTMFTIYFLKIKKYKPLKQVWILQALILQGSLGLGIQNQRIISKTREFMLTFIF